MAGRRRTGGYTLVEVLISVAIFSSTVTIACVALDQGLKQYQRVAETGVNFWDNAKFLWISKSFASAIDYTLSAGPQGSGTQGSYVYFVGTQEMVSFVTGTPFASDTPALVWLKKEKNEEGRTALVYYEVPVNTMTAEEIDRTYVFEDYKKGKSVVLLADVEDAEFAYFSYDQYGQRLSQSSSFEGKREKRLPAVVTVSFMAAVTKEKRRLVFGINAKNPRKADSGPF